MPTPVTLLSPEDQRFDSYCCAARLGNNDLFIAYIRTEHQPDGSILASVRGLRSTDHGGTWSRPFLLIDTPGMLDFDPNVIAWDDTIIVITTAVPLTHGQQVTTSKFISRRSEDSGHTWGEPVEIPFSWIYCSGKINGGVRFNDGTLVFGIGPDINIERGGTVTSDADVWAEAGVMISTDDGRTWVPGETIGITQEKGPNAEHRSINGLDEPAIEIGADGSVYMLMRSGHDRFYEARSTDQGRTWSPPRKTTLVAHDCPGEICTFDHPTRGRGWLVIYDHSPQKRYPIAVAVSFDEGHTWSKPLIIFDVQTNAHYPTCVQTAAGPILLVWQYDTLAEPGSRWMNSNQCNRELVARLLDPNEIDHL